MNRRLLLIMSHCWCTGHTAPPAHGYFSFFSFGLADIGALRVHFQQFSSVSSVSLQTKKCKDSEREWRHLSACSSQVGWQRHYPLKKKNQMETCYYDINNTSWMTTPGFSAASTDAFYFDSLHWFICTRLFLNVNTCSLFWCLTDVNSLIIIDNSCCHLKWSCLKDAVVELDIRLDYILVGNHFSRTESINNVECSNN